jgi:cardiolipin synthase
MEAMYLADLANATEIVPGWRQRPAEKRRVRPKHPQSRSRTVGLWQAAPSRLGNTVGPAIAGLALSTGTESRSLATVGSALLRVRFS